MTNLQKLGMIYRAMKQVNKSSLANPLEFKEAEIALESLIKETLLKSTNTRKLLDWLNQARVGYIDESDPAYWNFSIEELKEELATREHVINKAEAKEFRRKAARIKKHR